MSKKRQRLTGCVPTGVQIRKKEDGSDSRTIEGYAIVFGQRSVPMWTDSAGRECVEVIAPEAVSAELLDRSDIVMTMHHDVRYVLARSKNGKGTLSYGIDETGVRFWFEAPNTERGDEAIEMVKRGDIDGCSFAFSADYGDPGCVSSEVAEDNVRVYTVRSMSGIYDFTLTPTPAYPQTECEARSRESALAEKKNDDTKAEEWREDAKKLLGLLSEYNY